MAMSLTKAMKQIIASCQTIEVKDAANHLCLLDPLSIVVG